MSKVDLCDWWTRERIEAEDAVWRRDQYYIDYAQWIRGFMQKHNLKSVIELGCGAGYVARELNNEFKYLGTDGSSEMIAFAKEKNPNYDFKVLNIREMLASPNPSWDLVCSFAVFKHFPLDEWKTILMSMLSVARFGIIQVQLRQGYPSVDSGTQQIVGEPPIPHTWINAEELMEVVSHEHKILNLASTSKDMSPYMDHATESILFTEKKSK